MPYRFKSVLDFVSMLLFILANYWVLAQPQCRTESPILYYTTCVWLVLGYVIILFPVILCGCVIFCLPCVLVAMRLLDLGSDPAAAIGELTGTIGPWGEPAPRERKKVFNGVTDEEKEELKIVKYSELPLGEDGMPIQPSPSPNTKIGKDKKKRRMSAKSGFSISSLRGSLKRGESTIVASETDEITPGETSNQNCSCAESGSHQHEDSVLPEEQTPPNTPPSKTSSVLNFFRRRTTSSHSPTTSSPQQPTTAIDIPQSESPPASPESNNDADTGEDPDEGFYPYFHIPTAEDALCIICLGDYETGELLRILKCDHHFHLECIDGWLRINRVCPLCQRDAVGMTT
ncbi:hypothetical protein BKA69DRAFT_1099143 [Paraphysoderma sedebokerense]|nr:hypothetical protein BKA69DRAFT_1099143 [Paraphysoderma sedebokerense]